MELAGLAINAELMISGGVAVVAGMIRGFVGVGSGMLMAPVFAILYGPVETVGMVLLMDSVATAQLMPSVYRMIQWRFIIPMSIAAAVFMPAGTWLLISVDPVRMTRVIACAVMVFVLLMMAGWKYHGPKRIHMTMGVGALSGVLMGATSLGNPPVMLYLLSGSDTAAANRANFTGYFCLTLMFLLSMMAARGLIGPSTLMRAGALMPLFVIGAWAGARSFRKSGERLYRQVAVCLLFGVALWGVMR